MKIAIINDTHAGAKNGSDIFLDYVDKFYTNVFFPYCQEHGIKQIIHLGDYFDHRKYVNYRVLSRDKKMFLNKLAEHGMRMDIIPGNHDVYWNNTNSLCSLIEQLSQYPFITVHMDPVVKEYDGLNVALLPWITGDTYTNSMNFIQSAAAPILMGHLELAGFPIMHGGGIMSHGGMDISAFKRYEMVLSGHYHTKSQRENVHYLGTQFELTWADVNDPKYFHVLDTDTRELTGVRNPYKLFFKMTYDDSGDKIVIPNNIKQAKNAFIKVVVTSKKDPFTFDVFLDKIQELQPFDLKIVESYDQFDGAAVNDDQISIQDTHELLNSYVDAIATSLDKDRLKTVLHTLYVDALNVEIE